MKFCTFEVATHIGRHSRVGVCTDDVIIDVNFATAWYLSQQGEPEPQRLANALAPSGMLEFLRAGLRSMNAAEELFRESGPQPSGWWRQETAPRGPNDETLVYRPDEVRIAAPVPNPARVGTDMEVQCQAEPEYEMKLAAVIGKQGTDINSLEAREYIAGFTAMNDFGARLSALGPALVTPDEIGNAYNLPVAVRVNGELLAQANTSKLRSRFESAIESLSRSDIILPGDIIAFRLDLRVPVSRGDVVEFEIDRIGILRSSVL
jgi:2-keto-4-pentenoate hydratase/2-oxohepta-3-ene-1,7-dioic acid hydratase in catechol pathway